MKQSQVLIVGAGPTGLVLALWLTKLGVSVRIIDKADAPGTTSRALAVHARTLELYRQMGLDKDVVEKGWKTPAVQFWVGGRPEGRIAFDDIGAALTPYSFMEIFPQDQHERLLNARLESAGVRVERGTELLGFVDVDTHVVARLRSAEGREEACEALYLAGCDGARSIVRENIGVEFPGGTYRQVFYVADVEASGPAIDGELHLDLDEADFLAVFPLAGKGRARLVGTVSDERADRAAELRFEDVSRRIIESLQLQIDGVNWFSTYHVHHRVADRFRKGRAFLLGDAGHIHSPAGGQGMNTGIGDAINLAWKLQHVLSGRGPDELLDTYETERIAFARRLVSTTDRGFALATSDGALARLIRTRLAPAILPVLSKVEAWREWMFRAVSQIAISYRDSALSVGDAGEVHGGDRLPWVAVDGADNYEPLTAMTWQVHVYGRSGAELIDWCGQRRIPVHAYDWRAEYGNAGLAEDALYLLRPDTYVAMAKPVVSAADLERYFQKQRIRVS